MSLYVPARELIVVPTLQIALWALPKAGKTTFIVGNERMGIPSCPLPIWYLNYDNSIKEILKFCSDEVLDNLNIVTLAPERLPMTVPKADSILKKAEEACYEAADAIRREGRGTVAIDTATQHWQYIQMVELAGAKTNANGRPYQYEYGNANARYATLINSLSAVNGLTLVVVHHAKQVYDSNGKVIPGEYEAIDSPLTERLLPVVGQLWARDKPKGGADHGITFQFVRNNESLRGLALENQNHDTILEAIYDE